MELLLYVKKMNEPNKNFQKKILFIIDSLTGGGAERVVTLLANNLDRNKYKINIYLSLGRDTAYELRDDITIQFFCKPHLSNEPTSISKISSLIKDILKLFLKPIAYFFTFLRSAKRLRTVILEVKPDLIISTLINSNLITLLCLKIYKINVPVICRIDNIDSYEIKRLPYSFIYKLFLNYLYKKNKIHFICVSNASKEDLIKTFRLPENYISVIYNGIDTKKINLLKNEAIDDELASILEKKDFKIITAGRLERQKNHEFLLYAVKELLARLSVSLFILGKGSLEGFLLKKAKELGIEENVYFLGWRSNPFALFSKCDIFVLTSLYEGHPCAVLEAMAVGLPVVSTERFATREILLDKFGIYVPDVTPEGLAGAIYNLLVNKKRRLALSKASLERADEFSMEKMINEYDRLIEYVLNNG
ncbi:MAG: glycosyltransferase [Candidatus Pacearchaeota archaeon]